jgi:hypothetical protein
MANTTNYVSYQHAASGDKDFTFIFTITFSGSYVNGTGETINFLTAANPNGLELSGFLPVNSVDAGIPDTPGSSVAGYGFGFAAYSAGSAVLKFYSAPGTELASGAYPAGISGGTITAAIRHKG